jgi:GTPase SAR1 family protein
MFSLVSRPSFDNVKEKWYPEIAHFVPDVPVLLVGTQQSLRAQHMSPISYDEGGMLAQELGAVGYIEADALTHEGVQTVFDEATRLVLADAKSLTKSARKRDKR